MPVWERFARLYPTLDDVVDRCSEHAPILADEMRADLISLLVQHGKDWQLARLILAGSELFPTSSRPVVPA